MTLHRFGADAARSRSAQLLATVAESDVFRQRGKSLVANDDTRRRLRMESAWMSQAFDVGAHAVLSTSMDRVSLGTMLREIVRGSIVHRFEPRPAAAADERPLTLREQKILALLAPRATDEQIARTFWVTDQTVKFHLTNTYPKVRLHQAHRGEPLRILRRCRRGGRGTCLVNVTLETGARPSST